MNSTKSGRTTGPFVKNGVDMYETDSVMQWTTTIFQLLLWIGFFIYVGVAINNFSFKHTYTENPGVPGVLTSTRYSPRWFLVMLSVLAVGLMIFFISFMVIFRFSYGCHMLWFILYFLAFALLVVVVALLGSDYASCNTTKDNLCNDKRWCCVYFSDPANQCPNPTPCVGVTASDLVPSTEFLWMFWTLVAVGALNFFFLLVLIIYWFSPAPRVVEIPKEKEEEDEEAIEHNMESWAEPKVHGLRRRN